MRVDAFDFDLPEDRIALRPVTPRHAARQLIVKEGLLQDNKVENLPDWLEEGDVIVFNDTKVIPSYLFATRGEMHTECNLHQRVSPVAWKAFIKKSKRLKIGDVLTFGGGKLTATIAEKTDGGEVLLEFNVVPGQLESILADIGLMPLPPYIASKRAVDDKDKDDYQTLFAEKEGAVAAPTASLHFTDELMENLRKKGVRAVYLTLHVGAGTFLPMKVEDTKDHVMHAEWGEISAETAAVINAAHAAGRRVIAVGTTVLRLLESAADETGQVHPFSGETAIFITPGYRFRVVDLLMTNFHLPKSTLFMLVCAFAGTDTMKRAYAHAIAEGYRFYSYGDSGLLFRSDDSA